MTVSASSVSSAANTPAAPLRAGIVGCSGIAIAKAARSDAPRRTPLPHSHAAAFHAVPSTAVAAVCDVVPASTARYVELWEDIPQYTDYREMLARESLDLLSIVTPDHLHADIFVDACKAGVRGIFCEKPIATTLADADRMIEAAQKYGVKVVVNHTRRFDPFYRQAKWLIEQGKIGTLHRVIGTMGGERAMLFRNGTHLADTIAFFADSPTSWLIAETDGEQRWGTAYMGTGGRDAASEPGATAYIAFENGIRGLYNGSKGTTTNFELDLQGSAGRIRISDQIAELSLPVEGGGLTAQSMPASIVMKSGMVTAVEELVDSLDEEGDGAEALRAGRATLEILLGILVSADAGTARVDFPLKEGARAAGR